MFHEGKAFPRKYFIIDSQANVYPDDLLLVDPEQQL
jgi:hypothetical protein